MSKIVWGQGPRPYKQGVDRGVLYSGGVGVAWNGLIGVDEGDSSEVQVEHYLDGVRKVISQVLGDFTARIEAFTYPDEFDEHSGYGAYTSLNRFGLSYRVEVADSYQLHIVYNALVKPSERSWESLQGIPTPSTFLWDLQASAVHIPGASPGSHLVINAYETPEVMAEVEDILYGTEITEPRLPTPEELVDIFDSATMLKIVYNGDGTWTATGPDDMVIVHGDGSFTISSPSLEFLDQDIFRVSSY